MTKTKKIKAIALLIIFALSLILIVVGATMYNENNDDEGSPNSSTTVYAYESNSVYTYSKNYTIKFTPNSSGYYSIYIDGARFTKMEEGNGYSTPLSYDETNAYYNYTYYDFKYREYLSAGTTYYLKTNSENGETLSIYITK